MTGRTDATRFLIRGKRALDRPDLAWRYMTGRSVIEISLSEIRPFLPEAPVIVEAGALNGIDTIRFAEAWPGSQVHAFEPVPESFAEVVRRTAHLPNVTVYEYALGDRLGHSTIRISREDGRSPEDLRGSSTLLPPSGHLHHFPAISFEDAAAVEVVTLNSWAKSESVGQVDFLWLDLQGMELAALKGATEVLRGASAVHLEVAREELFEGAPTYSEIVAWMHSHGFRVAIDRVPVVVGNVLFVRNHGDTPSASVQSAPQRKDRASTLKIRLKGALKPTVRNLANMLVRQADISAEHLALQHLSLSDGLDLESRALNEADSALAQMVELILPRFEPLEPLTRVGGDADGGYVMARDFLGHTAISLGVGWDDSWERDALRLGATGVLQFDPTIRRPPSRIDRARFFRLGVAGERDRSLRHITFMDVLRLASSTGSAEFVIKMDVEGHEWGSLDSTRSSELRRVRQMAIELHDLQRIKETAFAQTAIRVLTKLNETHAPIHLRANNAVRLHRLGSLSTPEALEVTWLRRDLGRNRALPPTLLTAHDRPNDSRIPEVSLNGWLIGSRDRADES